MNRQALFCDGTESYVAPPEPAPFTSVTLRFRTAKADAVSVQLLTDDARMDLVKSETSGAFDYYTLTCALTDAPFAYCFCIQDKETTCYYNRLGAVDEPDPKDSFRILPGFAVPAWAKGAVMYQIFTDRFCNGDPANDVVDGEYVYLGEPVVHVKDWNQYPAAMDVRVFYGGDLEGVREKLSYLKDLGVEVLYFNPLFVSPSNHKYDTQDYDYIDPHLTVIPKEDGERMPDAAKDNRAATLYRTRTSDPENLAASNRYFIDFVAEVHRQGMRVILDGVFNHCGSFHRWMDREQIYAGQAGYAPGAYASADSPYRDYFHFQDGSEAAWPCNDSYEGWWGFETLPKLNYEESASLEAAILSVAAKWVSPPYNADGWRLDVAADLGHSEAYNHAFWQKFRRAVKDANPEAIILAEHYGSPKDYLQGNEWDTVMNYDAFMEPVTYFLTGMDKHSDAYFPDRLGDGELFFRSMRAHMADLSAPALLAAMNELSNHDHSRFLTRTNHQAGRVDTLGPHAAEEGIQPAVMREAVVMQMTWVGAPTIYYGDEAGLCGFTDPDNRRTYPWGREDAALLTFHRELIKLHKKSPALRTGSLFFLSCGEEYVSYARVRGEERMIVVIHNGAGTLSVSVPVWLAEVPAGSTLTRLVYTWEEDYTMETEVVPVPGPEMTISMEPFSAQILSSG